MIMAKKLRAVLVQKDDTLPIRHAAHLATTAAPIQNRTGGNTLRRRSSPPRRPSPALRPADFFTFLVSISTVNG